MELRESYRPDLSAMEYEGRWSDGCGMRRLIPSEMLGTTYFSLDLLKEDIRKGMDLAHTAKHVVHLFTDLRCVGAERPIAVDPHVRRYCSLEG